MTSSLLFSQPRQQEVPWDEISVQEMQDLIKKVEDFYAERGNPRINAIWLADTILHRLKNDLDYYVNCEGFKGYGKSNLLLLLALLQCRYAGIWRNKLTGKVVKVLPRTRPLPPEWEQIEVGFKFSKNMSFLDRTQDIQRKYNSIDRYHPFIIDEGSKNLHKYGWQNPVQFMLVKMSDTERYQNKAFYVCFPNFRELNSVFRNERIMMRLYIYARNESQNYSSCVISLRDINRYVADPWHTDENARTFEYLLRRVPAATRGPRHILYAEKKMAGYAGDFDIPSLKKLAPRIWGIYFRYKQENAQKDLKEESEAEEQEGKNVQRWKYAVKKLMAFIKEKHPEIRGRELSTMTEMSQTTLNELWKTELEPEKERRFKERVIAEATANLS